MIKGRDILLFLSVKYKGNWDDIYDAVKAKECFNDDDVIACKDSIKSNFITLMDDEYPDALKNVYKPPFVLYYYGDISLLQRYKDTLAVVGSREASDYSKKYTRAIITELEGKCIIISGMALGIDAIAHRSAIDSGGKTICVLGSGIDYPYPKTNKDIYDTCKKDHLIISEYPGDLAPEKSNFPFRNRLITGLSWGVFVPEVKTRSGTLVSVGHACQQNKDVMILPQPARNGTYNNHLISEGACLVESGDDILNEKN